MRTLPSLLRRHLAALRALLVLTAVCGVAYPFAVLAVAQLPGLRHRADGSSVTVAGRAVGSSLIGQSFTDKDGRPLKQYFQSRISNAGDGYDPTATAASNLGPEDVVDTRTDSLLTRVCAASLAVGRLEGVDGSRPFCTADGRGAVLAVFGPRDRTGEVVRPTRVVSVNQACPAKPFLVVYRGVRVECAARGADYSAGRIVPIRGDAPARPVVPTDAVTGSGSGLDPHISVAWARLQADRVARARGLPVARVLHLIDVHTTGRAFGFMGEPSVDVLGLNIALDRG
ncbi:potassium-transporting ATPase subunit C [Actinomadura rayongensis]|uniref:Potassium-transporting ATPase KdpC subunit n=1 Tax=Actinomadura rayongensis TaxID=1429076 RepID=A0A6I4W4D6_9ACTN|nr:potassium-transporting ATPase subunit C [Actinomadura rayongensis]MXQ64243.1 potassium-transporting ATPase subunit C [Actinomadura rayongensis]